MFQTTAYFPTYGRNSVAWCKMGGSFSIYTALYVLKFLSSGLLIFNLAPLFFGNYWTEVDDLHAVAQHFPESNRAISANVGHRSDVVLLFASKYSDIKTIVNLSEHYDMKAGIGEPFGKDYLERIRKDGFIDVKKRRSGSFDFHVTEESLMDRLGINMHEACLQIDKECRVFTIHGSSDEIIPVEDAFEFAKIISNHKLHVIEGANHIFSNHQGDLSSVVVNCIEETLHQVKGTAS
uniref:Serine aminopeptidase S33 domain-containing protein n=1 Tax=Glycine max TaxID=3847 RepID=A0A0R0GAS6_SOYBN